MDARLGANGLPFARCPPCKTAWSERSTLLKSLPDDPAKTVHPFIVARQREEVGGGMGLFVYAGIRKGEVVWAERKNSGPLSAVPRPRAWIEALPPASRKAYCHFMYKTGEDEYQSLAEFDEVPIEEYPNVRTIDVSSYMNHSCSPTCWFVQGGDEYEGVMVAVRDLVPGDEITYDYCTSEARPRTQPPHRHVPSRRRTPLRRTATSRRLGTATAAPSSAAGSSRARTGASPSCRSATVATSSRT